MFCIRADANGKIGTGHVMRCCSIGEAIKKQGIDVVFIVADECSASFVSEQGFRCFVLGSVWNDLDNEMDYLVKFIQEKRIEDLLVDSYFVTKKYLYTLQKVTNVTYIDDLHEMIYPCDKLINYTVYADKIPYQQEYIKTQLFLGCDYVPLREVFTEMPKKKIGVVENVLVMSGGTDQWQFLHRFLESIKEENWFPKIQFEVICGRYQENYNKLLEIEKDCYNVSLHINPKNVDIYMQKADIAISAGGTTLYELCACGTPTICYMLADNQENNVARFHELGVMYYCGDIRDKEYSFLQMKKKFNLLVLNSNLRKRLSTRMQTLVDGKGAERLAKALIKK